MSGLDLNAGALAAVADECERRELLVSGRIPDGLNGTLVRNGPNPVSGRFAGSDVLSWWPECAMQHAITLRDGTAVGYRNRWTRTATWARQAGRPVDGLIDSNPNVNVIEHAGRLLALAEGGPPVAISPQLDTHSDVVLPAAIAGGMTAHPKIDPGNDELCWFRADWHAPWLRCGTIDRHGNGTERGIEVPAPAMMHDMAITASSMVLMDLNVGYDFDMLRRGFRMPLCWQPSRQARLAVVPRNGDPERWYDIEPCFIQHVVNAFDDADGSINLDVVRYPFYFRLDADGTGMLPNPLGALWRYRLDPGSGRVQEQQLDDRHIELPRINESHTGGEYRYLYAVEQPSDVEMRGVVRYDLARGTTQLHAVPPGDQNSEPVFVAAGEDEDHGWLLVCMYRAASDTTDLVILDAADVAAPPVATVHLDRRIPAGFHGAWIADA